MVVLGIIQGRGVLLIRIIVRQGPTVLAVGADECNFHNFTLPYHISLFSISLGDG